MSGGQSTGERDAKIQEQRERRMALQAGASILSLWHLIDALGVDGTNSHDALDDARACAEVFFKLVNERNKEDG